MAVAQRLSESDIALQIIEEKQIAFLSKKYLLYQQGLWKEVPEETINTSIIEHLNQLGIAHNRYLIRKIREYLIDYAYQAHGAALQQRLLQTKRGQEAMFNNGVYSPATKSLRPYSPDDSVTAKIRFDYSPRPYICSLWQKFLEDILQPDKDKAERILFMQEWFGLSLIPDTSHEKALILVGDGSNGKSVLLSVWQELLGSDNYSAIDLSDITNEQYIAQLIGKLLNISSDVRSESQLDTGLFKKLVSGEVVTGKEIYQRPITFVNHARLALATNSLPFLKEGGHAIKRRLHLLRYPTFSSGR